MLKIQDIINILSESSMSQNTIKSHFMLIKSLHDNNIIDVLEKVNGKSVISEFAEKFQNSLINHKNYWKVEDIDRITETLFAMYHSKNKEPFDWILNNVVMQNNKVLYQKLFALSAINDFNEEQKNSLLKELLIVNDLECVRKMYEKTSIKIQDNNIWYNIRSAEMHIYLENTYPHLNEDEIWLGALLNHNRLLKEKEYSPCSKRKEYITYLEKKFEKKNLKEINKKIEDSIESHRMTKYLDLLKFSASSTEEAYKRLKSYSKWNSLILEGGVTTVMLAVKKNPELVNKLCGLKRNQDYIGLKDNNGNSLFDYFIQSENYGNSNYTSRKWLLDNFTLNEKFFVFNAPAKKYMEREYQAIIGLYGPAVLLGHDMQEANKKIQDLTQNGNEKRINNFTLYMQFCNEEQLIALPDFVIGSLLILYAVAKKSYGYDKILNTDFLLTLNPVLKCDKDYKSWLEEYSPDLISLFDKNELKALFSKGEKKIVKRL